MGTMGFGTRSPKGPIRDPWPAARMTPMYGESLNIVSKDYLARVAVIAAIAYPIDGAQQSVFKADGRFPVEAVARL